jgi:hypothetical protein
MVYQNRNRFAFGTSIIQELENGQIPRLLLSGSVEELCGAIPFSWGANY